MIVFWIALRCIRPIALHCIALYSGVLQYKTLIFVIGASLTIVSDIQRYSQYSTVHHKIALQYNKLQYKTTLQHQQTNSKQLFHSFILPNPN